MEFSNEKVVGTITIKKEIAEKQFDYIICGALEGGIGYWAVLDSSTEDYKAKPKGVATSEWTSKLLLEGKTVTLFDNEAESENEAEKWELTLEKVLKGIELNAINRPHDSDLENADVYTYDCIIQYGLFGKLVFG